MHKASLAIAALFTALIAGPALAEMEEIPPNRITIVMTPGITSWRQLPSRDLVDARRNLGQGRPVSNTQLRRLADLGDGFAALRYAQRLDEAGAARPVDVAHYYGMAAATGRNGAIVHLIRWLDQVDPAAASPQRLAVLRGIVIAYAQAGNSVAAEALIRYHWRQVPFGPLYYEVEMVLASLDGELGATLSLDHSLAILQDRQHTPQDLVNVQSYLTTARQSTSLQTRLVAQNLQPLLDAALANYGAWPTEDPQ